jgi:hypothetical protein
MDTNLETADFSALQLEKPYKSYRKTILGQVYVKILNPFNNLESQGLILSGEDNFSDNATVDTWNPKEDKFLHAANKAHFEQGYLIEFERPETREVSEEERLSNLPDDEMRKLVKAKYFTLEASVNKMNSEAPLYRLLKVAEEEERSDKIVNLIKGRLSEVQGLSQPPQMVE